MNVVNGCLYLDSGEMDYIRFGCGDKILVMIPGVGDGLKTVRGMALPFAFLYRTLYRDFTVYVFSRRTNLAPRMGTREMAADLNLAMEMLGLSEVSVVGVSQGGMITQWLAIDHPDKAARLVLTVTLRRCQKMDSDGKRKGLPGDIAGYRRKILFREAYSECTYHVPISGEIGETPQFQAFHNSGTILCHTQRLGGAASDYLPGTCNRRCRRPDRDRRSLSGNRRQDSREQADHV